MEVRVLHDADYPDIVDQTFRTIVNRWLDVTLLSVERLWSLYAAARHIVESKLKGAIVECGTFRGGSIAVILETLVSLGDTDRDIYLFDTFDGFPEDVDELMIDGTRFRRQDWFTESFRDIFEKNILKTGYPLDHVHVCAGFVELLIPSSLPSVIAMAHMDVDYYRATKHVLTHLYPRLIRGGVMQIDDYGHFFGCRSAVDEYFASVDSRPLLQRVDYSGRCGIKP